VYAIALTQMGVPLDKIRIGFNMLKYCTVEYQQKNGTVKTRDIERYKIGESLQTNAKMWLKDARYSQDDIDEYLKMLIDTNDINILPEEVRSKYKMLDCFVWVPLTQQLVDKWTENIVSTIDEILSVEQQYNQMHDEMLWWDDEEHVKSESFYFATLSGYSANLNKPYAKYLDNINTENNNVGLFNNNMVNDDSDLSWLDTLL